MTSLTIAVRFVHIAASISALGVFAFACLIGQPAVQRAGAAARARFARFSDIQWRILAWSLAALFVSAVAAFVLQAAVMTGSSLAEVFAADTFSAALGTQYGRVWLVRQALWLALAVICALLIRGTRSPALPYAGLALAAGHLAASAFAGHAAAGEGVALIVALGADVLHLLAAGTWLGSLAPLALLLAWCRRSEHEWAGAVAREATRRFSWLGIVCVATLVAAGLVNAWNLVGDIAPLVGTSYGRWLLLKIALLLPLLAFAAANLLRLRPQLLSAPPRVRSFVFGGILAALQRNTVGEAALGILILMIVALLGVTPPARHVPPEWPFPFRFSWDVAQAIPEKRTLVITGAGIAALALLAFGYAAVSRRRRRWAWAGGVALVAGGGAVALPALSLDAYPTTYRRPAVAYQAISVANGAQLYRQHCVGCHGVSGYGDGPAGVGLHPKPADLTAKHTGDHTAGDLFWWLTHGKDKTAMPGFKDSVSEEGRWDLINFLRGLSAAEQAREMAPLLERPWLVAPDFGYRTLRGEYQSLKEHRGKNAVLLVLYTPPASQPRLRQLEALYRQMAAAGVEILAVARDARGARPAPFSVVTEGAEEIYETYGLFRRSLSEDGMRPDAPLPAHMEFLIDRQGYIRARWIAAENTGWANADILLEEIARLNREQPSASAPDDHVH